MVCGQSNCTLLASYSLRTRASSSCSVRARGAAGTVGRAASIAAPPAAELAPAPGAAIGPGDAGACGAAESLVDTATRGAMRKPLSEPCGLPLPELESSSNGSSGSAPGKPRASAAPNRLLCGPAKEQGIWVWKQ